MPLTPEKKQALMELAGKYADEARELSRQLYQKQKELAEKLKAGAPEEEVAPLRDEIERIKQRISDAVALRDYAFRMTRISDEELWGEFLGDIRRVVEEPPRREGEREEEIEERRRFARRLYGIASRGIGEMEEEEEESDIWRAIRALRLAKSRLFKSKEELMDGIQAVIDLCDTLKESLLGVVVEDRRGENHRDAIIRGVERVKGIMEDVKSKLESGIELDEDTDFHFRWWTRGGGEGGANFMSPISQFVSWYVEETDEAKARELRNIAERLTYALLRVGWLYERYKKGQSI